MPMQQALAQEDLSAMRLLPVPHVGRPFDDCPPTAAAERDRPTGTAALEHQRAAETAFAEQVGGRPGEPGDGGHAWTRQFAVLLAEALTGARPVRQIMPWLSQRGTVHLYRLLPLFGGGQGVRVQRVLTTQSSPDVIEMTVIVAAGPRTRALAVRLARAEPTPPPPQWRGKLPPRAAPARTVTVPWLCTDIEAG